MTSQSNPRIVSSLQSVSQAAGAAVILVGFLVLVGWVLDITALKSIFPGLVTMKANTALAFILAGVSLGLLLKEQANQRRRRIAQTCAVIVTLIGLLTFSQYLFGWDLGIDQLLFREPPGAVGTSSPGRMAHGAAMNFLMLGLALLLLDVETRRGHRPAQVLTVAAATVSFVALAGYIYGARFLYSVGVYTQMAVHSAVTFIILSIGLLFARPDRGLMGLIASETVGGVVARRLLPATIGIPLVLAGLSMEGEHAGLFGPELSTAILATSMVGTLTVLVWWSAGSLHRRDVESQRAEQALRESEESYRALVENLPICIYEIDRAGRVISMNLAGLKMMGATDEGQVHGMAYLDAVSRADRPRVSGLLARAFAGESSEFEFVAAKEGEHRILASCFIPLRGEGGTVHKLMGITQDITERKRAEDDLHALYQAGLAIQEPVGLKERLDRLLQTAQTVLDLDRVNILLADPEEQWLQAVASLGVEDPLEAIRVPIGPAGGGLAHAYESMQMIVWDGHAPLPEALRLQPPYDQIEALRSQVFANVPLVVQGRAIGVLGADRKRSRRPLDAATLELLQLFAAQAAVAIHNGRLFKQVQAGRERLQTLSRQLVAVQEAERHHLARELHDEIGQMLTGVKLTLEMSMRSSPDAIRTTLGEAQGQLNDLIARVRTLSLDLRPAMLDDLGLVPALLWHFERYTAQTSVRVEFRQAGLEGRLRPEVETAVYRIVQEALTNVARHAGVNEATVILCGGQDILDVQVQDQGRGFNPPTALGTYTSNGLAGMSERAELLGGHLKVESAPGAGTSVTAKFPVIGRIDKRKKPR